MQIKANDINLIPKFKAVDFEESDGEFVFILHSTIELDDDYLKALRPILFGETAVDVEGTDHLWLLYPDDAIQIEKVKRVLVPFL